MLFNIIFDLILQKSNMIQEYQTMNHTIHLQKPSLIFSKLSPDSKSYQPLIRIKFAEYQAQSNQVPIQIKQNHWTWQQVFIFRELSNDQQTLIIQILQQSSRQVKLSLSSLIKLEEQSINMCFNENGCEGNFEIDLVFEQDLISSNQEKKQKLSSKRSAIKESSLYQQKKMTSSIIKENKQQLSQKQLPRQSSKITRSSRNQQIISDIPQVQASKILPKSKQKIETNSIKRGSQTSKTVQNFLTNQKKIQKQTQKPSEKQSQKQSQRHSQQLSQKQLSSKRSSNQNLLSKRSDQNISKLSHLNNLSNRQKQILNSQKLLPKTDLNQQQSSRSNLVLKNSMDLTKSVAPLIQSNIDSKRSSQRISQQKLNLFDDSKKIDQKLASNRISDYSQKELLKIKQSQNMETDIVKKLDPQKNSERKNNEEELYHQSYQHNEQEYDIQLKDNKVNSASKKSYQASSSRKQNANSNRQVKQQLLLHNNLTIEQNQHENENKQQQTNKDIENIVKKELRNIQRHIFQLQQAKENENKFEEFQELINARKKANQSVLLEAHSPYLQKLQDQKFNRIQQQQNNQGHTQNKGVLYKSRLGEIAKNIRTRYGDKIYENQSATTMQKSIHCYSVPKGPRFIGLKYNGVQPSYYVKTCFEPFGKKGTSFGFGKRKPFPDWLQRNMKQIPAPNTYMENSMTLQALTSPKGYSFGIPYSYYKKVRIVGAQNQVITNKNLSRAESMSKLQKKNSVKMPPLDSHYHYNQLYKYR